MAPSRDHIIPGHDPMVMRLYPAVDGFDDRVAQLDLPPACYPSTVNSLVAAVPIFNAIIMQYLLTRFDYRRGGETNKAVVIIVNLPFGICWVAVIVNHAASKHA